MAGVYPNVPGHRFVYDLDGSSIQCRSADGTLRFSASQAQMQALQDETNSGVQWLPFNAVTYISIVFPEPRSITGLFNYDDYSLLNETAWSSDSADGWGGTWTVVSNPTKSAISPNYRTSINTVSLNNVTALRYRYGALVNSSYDFWIRTIQIYGDYASATGDRLEFWHPTLDQKIDVAHFDLGDVKRGATMLKQFRIKNLSTTLTANSIAISAGALTVGSPSHVTMHTFSTDNNSYSASINIGNLAPGAISGVLYDKFVSSMTTPTGPWSGRLSAVAGSWT